MKLAASSLGFSLAAFGTEAGPAEITVTGATARCHSSQPWKQRSVADGGTDVSARQLRGGKGAVG